MRQIVVMTIATLIVAASALAGDKPAVKTLSDADLYLQAKLEKLEKDKATALEEAQQKIQRELALQYAAQIGDLKRQLIAERAKVAELQKKVDDLTAMLKAGLSTSAPQPPPKRWGKPAFADGFSAAEISDGWAKQHLKPGGDFFRVVDGMLTGKEKISIAQKFSGKALHVEYDTWTMSETPCDASLYAESPESDLVIFVGIGSDLNKQCRVNIGEDIVAKKGGIFLRRGKRQHLAIDLGQGKVRIEVDGQTVLDYTGDKAPKQLKDVTLSLYSWTPGMHFDNVRVYVVE